MDELADEFSGTCLDGDVTNSKDVPMKSKNIKPANRTASIINRSKLLILSDSETDEEGDLNKKHFSKHLRISKQKATYWKPRNYSKMLSKGKRKRNSASEVTVCPNNIFATGSSGLNCTSNRVKSDSMEIECDNCDSDSSVLSDEPPTECNFDGDDEQSDFPESNANASRFRNRVYCHSRSKLEFKMPSRPANPFFTVDLESHHPPPTALWKRRRPLH